MTHKNRKKDPRSGSAIRKNSGPGSVSGSALNQCGSETLLGTISEFLFCIAGLVRAPSSRVAVADPGCLSRILIFVHSGFPDPETATKERGEKICCLTFFCSYKYHKM
jgi:hypothetical protein